MSTSDVRKTKQWTHRGEYLDPW